MRRHAKIRSARRLAPLVLGAALAGAALAGVATAGAASAGPLALDDARLAASQTLSVSIPGDAADGTLSLNYTADGRNLSPPLSWTPGPPGTAAYVVIMQDPDATADAPALHWLLYNVPAGMTGLPRGMKNLAAPTHPLGTGQGENAHGSYGYTGPRLPADAAAHRYHFQVFAVDRRLRVGPGASLSAVERAMAGHVLARGELVVPYAPPKPKVRPEATPSPSAAPG